MTLTAHIPQYGLSPEAHKGILIANLNQHGRYIRHTIGIPHRDDHFTLLLLTSGSFKVKIDFEPVTINYPAILVVRPEQVHQVEAIADATGWLLNIDPRLLPADIIDPLYTYATGVIPVDQDAPTTHQLAGVLQAIDSLVAINRDVFSQRALVSFTHALFNLVLSVASTQHRLTEKIDRSSLIYQQFRLLLEVHYTEWKSPHHYADRLSLSPVYFNDTIRKRSGQSVSSHIQERNVLEAKRLLVYTEHTVSEVSHQLGYEDPIYFGKLFKKHTQLSPLQFKAKYRE
ncbi:helix-turn-helix domain-containing protein [Spirosoma linguale]|uniref:Transcriptional regulator, AraC family n=1 Tax=Spirosoma linguale (strain ATCC 33905 / DSM 74 / LMG 10896 / Claus 1) TaxID=504472 RepID=D2QC17_SPILD|nr:transcriptional regulator, AraC family [Spirosoma linguale DSM 74]